MKPTGFTLIELVVVIAIIALLMAILVPSLQHSRQQAKAALCGSNIKQLTIGLLMYETEYKTLPHAFDNTPMDSPPGGYPGNPMYDRMGWWWFNYISNYSRKGKGNETVLWCPSRQMSKRRLEGNVLCGNYGVNQSICKSTFGGYAEFIGMPLSTADILHASQTLLLADSGYSMITWWHVTDTPPVALGNTKIVDAAYIPGLKINAERDLWPGQEWDAIYGRHPNKSVNIGFADGHVSRTKADDLFVEEDGGNYKNRSPLWLPK
ncbi:MAG: prepilin-type N-terminal cleavage/methylation domain-containing protein [Planctomycetota bacterium]|jgi:prepilin-type N-terminal cleavage/methylation domain-containing protein/prepilin-type processing-associated H-X9-DG protein